MRGEDSTGANVVSCNRRDVSHFIAESPANKTGAIHKLSELFIGAERGRRGRGSIKLVLYLTDKGGGSEGKRSNVTFPVKCVGPSMLPMPDLISMCEGGGCCSCKKFPNKALRNLFTHGWTILYMGGYLFGIHKLFQQTEMGGALRQVFYPIHPLKSLPLAITTGKTNQTITNCFIPQY